MCQLVKTSAGKKHSVLIYCIEVDFHIVAYQYLCYVSRQYYHVHKCSHNVLERVSPCTELDIEMYGKL